MEYNAQNILSSAVGLLVAALTWVVRGYAVDVKKIKGTYMTRTEIEAKVAESHKTMTEQLGVHQASTAAAFAELRAAAQSRQEENSANFRELRVRLDTLNDTLLKVAMKS